MTSEEVIAALKQVAPQDKALAQYPFQAAQYPHDFLGGAVHLRVTILHPNHPILRHYVAAPGGKVYRPRAGEAELERMRTDLKLRIADADQALRYAQWVLDVTDGPALRLLSSAADIPFPADVAGDLANKIEDAKKELARKVSAPTARPRENGFDITQEAVHRSDLVRYEVQVSTDGRIEVKKEILARNVPGVSLR